MGALNPDIIKCIHQALRFDNGGVSQTFLRDQVTSKTLGFFLEVCHDKIKSLDFDAHVIRGIAKEALAMADLHHRHTEAIPSSSFVSWVSSEISSQRPEDCKSMAADMHFIISTLREFIATVRAFQESHMQAIKEQYGAILKHASMNEIMQKLGDSINTATTKSLMKQLGAVHAVMHCANNGEVADLLQSVDRYLRDVLMENK
jgi:hypothetical protein